jgi:GT2 family glycosyltransferase
MPKVSLSIVIVTYNSEDLIIDCLDSIYNTCKKNSFEIVISDNSPNDATYQIIEKNKKRFNNLTFIKNSDNLGFSKANNVGIKKTSGEYVLFLNPDMKLYEKTLDGMIDFMRGHKDAGAATCDVMLLNGKHDDSSHRGFPTPWRALCHFSGISKVFPASRLFAGYNMTYLDFTKTHEIEALAGSFMIVPRVIGEILSWWDEDYFFYGEDIDFCYRIKALGYKIYFVPQFRALHYKGVSSGIKSVSKNITKASRETKIMVTNWRFDAMMIFYDKHYKKKYPSLLRSFVLAGISVRKFFALRKI